MGTMGSSPLVGVDIDSRGVALVRMQDVAGKNALSREMVEALRAALDGIAQNAEVAAVVLAGLPEYFCTGANEAMLLDIVERSVAPSDLLLPRWLLGIAVPTIAAVEGHALGGGLAVALCADMVVMSSESRYGCTFMKMGFTP